MKDNYKKRTPNKKKKLKLKTKSILLLPFILMSLAIVLLTYISLGGDFALIIGIILTIILLIIAMLNNIKNSRKRKRIISLILVVLLTAAIILVVIFCAFIIYIKSLADPKFKVSKLNTPEMTILYDKDDKEFARLGAEQREKVTYDQLPEVLVDAIVATEDSRYSNIMDLMHQDS